MLHLIIGRGKGKTTSAVGSAVRAAGHGKSVIFAQFLKDGSSGEVGVLRGIDGVTVITPAVNYGFTFQMTAAQLTDTAAEYARMLEDIAGREAFLIVLDEVLHALNTGLVNREQLEPILDKDCELVLTGYDPPAWLRERAAYISEVVNVKHPYDNGVEAREGVEY